ncbi:ABC transporter ATP-binding protein [uncultured Desulfobacter sp.]|uniref:ABC transporter ATP-binding protein n=1 Tax=uncultured Desulfobacter sp. TaxID=240139 RepID=UPI002AAB207A|nr:ABC transporter ATP-binding protein [uncultured Desulfobacter sp.]
MISIENLRLTVEGREILKGIDMHLAPGEIYGLLGPNGAGKSTTIFSLLGLRSRQSGRIRVLGSDPADNAVAIRRSIGVMPEKSGFYDWMAASDYLEWYGSFYGYESTGRDQETMLEKVGLGKEAHRPIGTYSRGMKQRLAVARALVSRPKLLILDEPTNGLDPKGRHELHDLLVEFASDRKRGVLLCTHVLDDVDRLCSRIGIIDNGRTRLEGSLVDLLSEQGGGQRYRLRLESEPDTDKLPAGITVLGNQGSWWRIQVQVKPSQELSPLWGELWRRGWKIMEIRSEASRLEEIYMQYTNHKRHDTQEVA